MSNKLFSSKTILIDALFQTQSEVFDFIAQNSVQQGWIKDANLIKTALNERESLGTTGFEKGIAIPHCRVKDLSEAKIYFLKLKKGIDWQAMDGQPSQFVFSILVPQSNEAGDQHLEILGKLSTGLMDQEVLDSLKAVNSAGEAEEFLNKILFQDEEIKPENFLTNEGQNPFYVAVSACTFGLSHTYMVEKKLQMFAKEHHFDIKIETHGSKGDLNFITSEDLKKAQGVLIAVDRDLDLRDLPNHVNVYKTTTAEVMKNPQNCFDYLTGIKKQNLRQSELKNLFKIKIPGNFMKTATGIITFSQWFILLTAILYLISFGFPGNTFFEDSFKYIRYGSIGVAPVAAFWLTCTFTKSKTTSYCYAFVFLLFNVALLMKNEQSSGLGIFTVLFLFLIPLIYVKVIYKDIKGWFKQHTKLRGGILWIFQASFVVVMFVTLYYSHTWFSTINHDLWKAILNWDQNYWLFRWGVAFLFMGLMIFDMGGPINKASIIISAILFGDSFAANIGAVGGDFVQPNVFTTPLTAQILGITIPGISLWVRSWLIGKSLDEEELTLCRESGKKAFNGISEHALWTYQRYKKVALPAHLLNVLGCSLIIALLHIQYFGGYNNILGTIFGLSFDNVLSNQYFNVMPKNMPSFNLGFLILNVVGPLWGGLVYSSLFQKKFKVAFKTI